LRLRLGERFAGFVMALQVGRIRAPIVALDGWRARVRPRKFNPEVRSLGSRNATGEFAISTTRGLLVHSLRLPAGSNLALFSMARNCRLIAHASEPLQHGKLSVPARIVRRSWVGSRAAGRGRRRQRLVIDQAVLTNHLALL